MEKKVTQREFNFLQRSINAGISPPITGIKVTTSEYPMTLGQYVDEGGNHLDFADKISEKIQDLHELGIIHGDLHSNNIVVDPSTGEVRLIDFGGSYLLEEVDEYVLAALVEFSDPDTPFTNLEDVLAFEHVIYLRDFEC